MARKFKTPTGAQRRRLTRLRAARGAAMDAVYAGTTALPFNDCYLRSPAHVRRAYDAACAAVDAFERELAAEGRGWVDGRGHFNPY